MAAAAPYIIMAVSTAMSMSAQDEEGEITAAQHARAAKASSARGSRESTEVRRQGEIIKSDTVAAMVAGGGVSDDAGAIKHISDIEEAVDFNALAAIYEGETRAKEHRVARKDVKSMTRKRTQATALQGASKAYSYGAS